jgi:polyisoprenoid-binding protein YceI
MSTIREVVLEPAEQEFADASANPSYLFQRGPEEGNKVVDETATSLNTDCDKRDADLRGAAFFDVARFPTISFHANGMQPCAEHPRASVSTPQAPSVGTTSE